jgi:hypothetical protein
MIGVFDRQKSLMSNMSLILIIKGGIQVKMGQ